MNAPAEGASRAAERARKAETYWALWQICDHASMAPLDFRVGDDVWTFRILYGEIGTYYMVVAPHGRKASHSFDEILDYVYAASR